MDVEIEQPHIHSASHHASSRHWSDYAISLSALFVSLVSILIAWQHGEEMKKLVRANSFPYVQLFESDEDAQGKPIFALSVSNEGVGPAQIRTAQLLVDGRPQPSSAALLQACCHLDAKHVGFSSITGRMLRPGESASYVIAAGTNAGEPARKALRDAFSRHRLKTRVCFCSVFDECWTAESGNLAQPEAVRECPPVDVLFRP